MRHPLLDAIAAFGPVDLLRGATTDGLLPVLRVALGGKPPAERTGLQDRDPDFVARFMEAVLWLGRWYFRHRVYGLEHVPRQGPAILVGNHNGGLTAVDWALAVASIYRAYGPERAVYGLGHDFLQWSPFLRRYAGKLGTLRASHDAALEALGLGHLVIVFPGSDYDAFRPFSERDRVVLAGRTGFVELALRSRAPIVPVVTAGAQEQFIVLTRGERIASLLGLKRRLRSNVFPLALSVPWGLAPALVPHVPLPVQITTAFLPAMAWPELGTEAASDAVAVERCYREVEAAMQARLDTLTLGRIPFLG